MSAKIICKMGKYLLLAFIFFFLWTGILAESYPTDPLDPKCMDYAVPEPPCCGSNNLAARLKGGIQINKTAGEFPWWVTVDINPLQSCIGSILNTRWVITAAHCSNKSLSFIQPVHYDGPPGGNNTAFVDFTVTREGVDIALLHLAQPIVYDKLNIPLCLPISRVLKKRNYHKTNATVVGWGGGRRRIELQVKSMENGRSIFYDHVTRGGDSGGAVVMQSDENPRKINAFYALAIHASAAKYLSFAFTVTGHVEWVKSVISIDDPENLLPR